MRVVPPAEKLASLCKGHRMASCYVHSLDVLGTQCVQEDWGCEPVAFARSRLELVASMDVTAQPYLRRQPAGPAQPCCTSSAVYGVHSVGLGALQAATLVRERASWTTRGPATYRSDAGDVVASQRTDVNKVCARLRLTEVDAALRFAAVL
jgi:hypothetical protein